jgi:hypothetical protein
MTYSLVASPSPLRCLASAPCSVIPNQIRTPKKTHQSLLWHDSPRALGNASAARVTRHRCTPSPLRRQAGDHPVQGALLALVQALSPEDAPQRIGGPWLCHGLPLPLRKRILVNGVAIAYAHTLIRAKSGKMIQATMLTRPEEGPAILSYIVIRMSVIIDA